MFSFFFSKIGKVVTKLRFFFYNCLKVCHSTNIQWGHIIRPRNKSAISSNRWKIVNRNFSVRIFFAYRRIADRHFLEFSYLRMLKSRIEECLILYFFVSMTIRSRYFTAPKVNSPNL